MNSYVRRVPLLATLLFSVVVMIYFFFKIPGYGYSNIERSCYIVVYFYSVMMLLCLCYIVARPDFYVFEPITILWFLFFGVYGLQPMVDLLDRSTSLGGISALRGGIKCTVIVAVSFLFLCYFYYKQKTKVTLNRRFESCKTVYVKYKNANQIATFNTIIWIISGFLFFLYLYKVRGLSLRYILSAGTSGEFNSAQVSSTPLGFLSNFACTMIAAFMYVLYYGKNRAIKIGMGIATLILFVLNGYRFIIVVYALALMSHYYISRHKKPKMITLGIAFTLLLVMAAVLASARNGLRHGEGWNVAEISIEMILSPFESNFILYRPLWRMVELYPSQYSYTFGYQMFFYTLILLIPRAVWPGKPLPPARDVLMNLYNNKAIAGTQAFSSIGEFYQEFGIIGCLFFMSLTGYICGRVTRLYNKEIITDNDLILYSMIFPIVFSLTNGGYTPNNFYMVLFALSPIIATKLLVPEIIDE